MVIMKILKLADNPQYFDEFTKSLFIEWKDVFIAMKYTTLLDVKKMYIKLFNNGTVAYICIKDDGELIGFYTLLKHKRTVHLCDLFIKPQYRGRGLGQKLVRHAIYHIHEFDSLCNHIYISAYINTVTFYLKLGFTIVKKSDNNTYTMIYTINHNKNNYVYYIFCIIAAIILLWWMMIL